MDGYPWHRHPRSLLGHWPTPLEHLPRLTAELGGPNIWLKRDDCTGLATGGNKTRKLEYLLGDALSQGADTVMTFGAVQSNHARQTAAACAKLALDCHLVLSRRVPSEAENYESGGNVLLDRLLGATLHITDLDSTKPATTELLDSLQREGKNVYTIPSGGSNAVGALGYALCAEELATQCGDLGIAPGYVMHASASSGTQAGFALGLAYMAQDRSFSPEHIGINVFHPDPSTLVGYVDDLVQQMCDADAVEVSVPSATVNHAYVGQGYGIPTEETLAAIRLAAELEGLLFDPVYSGKALAALIDQISIGNFSDTSDVVLIHTGGAVALNVYADQL